MHPALEGISLITMGQHYDDSMITVSHGIPCQNLTSHCMLREEQADVLALLRPDTH